MNQTHLTNDNYEEFVKLYKKAKHTGVKTFMFYGKEVVTDFAKYFIEFYKLKTQSKK
jgi:hypothetical protein|tara:strand:- start:20038 stop:20208 length:171 start_codon:yes stop_codon:yes gene_type:complete